MINYPLPAKFPHMQADSIMQMGMQVVSKGQWLQPCIDLDPYYKHKCAVKKTMGKHVFDALDISKLAQQELGLLLQRHLLRDHHQVYQLLDNQLIHLPSGITFTTPKASAEHHLWHTSLWVADDLLLMQELDGHYCLTAASLCSPSSWHLQEKLGKPMARIHDPIPQIHRRLTPQIDRFLHNMTAGQVVERFNWSLQGAMSLTELPSVDMVPLTSDSKVYYRMERQSLMRLPQTQSIVFGIRVYIYELSQLAPLPDVLASLQRAITALPKDLQKYKNIDHFMPALPKYWELLCHLE